MTAYTSKLPNIKSLITNMSKSDKNNISTEKLSSSSAFSDKVKKAVASPVVKIGGLLFAGLALAGYQISKSRHEASKTKSNLASDRYPKLKAFEFNEDVLKENVLVFGKNESGVNSNIIIPFLITQASKGSKYTFVFDSKSPDIYLKLADVWHRKNNEVVFFDPWIENCKNTFNPISFAENKEDLYTIANAHITHLCKFKNLFSDEQKMLAVDFLTLMLIAAKQAGILEAAKGNLPYVAQIFKLGESEAKKFLAEFLTNESDLIKLNEVYEKFNASFFRVMFLRLSECFSFYLDQPAKKAFSGNSLNDHLDFVFNKNNENEKFDAIKHKLKRKLFIFGAGYRSHQNKAYSVNQMVSEILLNKINRYNSEDFNESSAREADLSVQIILSDICRFHYLNDFSAIIKSSYKNKVKIFATAHNRDDVRKAFHSFDFILQAFKCSVYLSGTMLTDKDSIMNFARQQMDNQNNKHGMLGAVRLANSTSSSISLNLPDGTAIVENKGVINLYAAEAYYNVAYMNALVEESEVKGQRTLFK